MDYTFILGIDVASSKLDLCLCDVESKERIFKTIDYCYLSLQNFLQEHSYVVP